MIEEDGICDLDLLPDGATVTNGRPLDANSLCHGSTLPHHAVGANL